MQSDRAILAGGIVIITVGFVSAAVNNRPKTKVFVGGTGIVLLSSLVAMAGGGAEKIAVAFMGLATVTVLLVELPDVFKALNKAQGVKIVNIGGVTVTSRQAGQTGGTYTVNTGGVTVRSRTGGQTGNPNTGANF